MWTMFILLCTISMYSSVGNIAPVIVAVVYVGTVVVIFYFHFMGFD